MTRLQKLLDLAGKATPGPWTAIHAPIRFKGHDPIFKDGIAHIYQPGDVEKMPICSVDYGDDNSPAWRHHAAEVGEYIASANPATIKQLVELVEAQHAVIHNLVKKTPFKPSVGRVEVIITMDRIAEQKEALRLYDAFNQEGDAG